MYVSSYNGRSGTPRRKGASHARRYAAAAGGGASGSTTAATPNEREAAPIGEGNFDWGLSVLRRGNGTLGHARRNINTQEGEMEERYDGGRAAEGADHKG